MDVKIENLTLPEGVQEVVIRTGDAAVIEPGKRIAITGNIGSPVEFFNKRKPNPKACYAFVSKEKRSVRLEVEEALVHGGHCIVGVLKLASEIEAFNINGTRRFSHKELLDLLKKYSYIFEDRDAHKTLVQQLQMFKVSVTKTVEDIDNQRGSVKKLTEWKAADDITFVFKIKYPIYSGDEELTFSVEACLDVTDRDVTYYLVSGELNELMETRFQNLVTSQTKTLDEAGVVVIVE